MYKDTYQPFVNLLEGTNETKFNAGKQQNLFKLKKVKRNYLNVSYKMTNKYLPRKSGI